MPRPYEEIIRQPTFWERLQVAMPEGMYNAAREYSGIGSSERLMQGIMSPPQNMTGWQKADYAAGLVADALNTAFAAGDWAAVTAIAQRYGSTVLRNIPWQEMATTARRQLASEAGAVGKVEPKRIPGGAEYAKLKRYELLGIELRTEKEALNAIQELKAIGLQPDYFVGDIKAERTLRVKIERELGDRGKGFLRWVERQRNRSAIHPNNKTLLSLDFSTSCPKRGRCCPYCYVEQSRLSKELGLHFMHGKKVVETPYAREILAMPSELITQVNRDGGLRMFSFSDFRPGIDDMQVALALHDAEVKGAIIKAITKEPEFVNKFGNHPNLRINISVDNVPRGISNAPTIDDAIRLKAGRDNIKVRAVALNEKEAEIFGADPRIDVLTLYHGKTGDDLKKIIRVQNPDLIEKMGEKELDAWLDTWENMPPNSKAFKRTAKKYGHKVCCQGGKCSRDPTKCGFGLGALAMTLGVHLPEMERE